MNYTRKIFSSLISRLQKKSYIGQTPWYSPVPFSSNPDNPSASQQAFLNNQGSDSKFCSKCNSKNIKKKGKEYVCMDCNTRFSDSHFQFNNTPGSTQPGLLDLDNTGQASQYHPDYQIGAGSASVSWGKGDKS